MISSPCRAAACVPEYAALLPGYKCNEYPASVVDVNIQLNAVHESDAQRWHALRQDPDARRFMPLLESSVSELALRLANCTSDTADMSGREIMFSVGYEGHRVGFVGASNASMQMRHAEISYTVHSSYRRRGIACAAVSMFVDRLFAGGYRRLYATISIDNIASLQLIRKLGFTHEGTLREHYLIAGREVDQAIFGLLADERSKPAEAQQQT